MYSNDMSFRDPAGFLYESQGTLYRLVHPKFKKFVVDLIESNFFKKNVENKQIAETAVAELPSALSGSFADYLCMQHKAIEFVSYPWEWSFEQLKQAALLTLDLQLDALKNNLSLKDATSLNVVFDGNKPVFVDVLSFEPYIEGKPWIAYGQFCRCFLFPLMITTYTSLDFNKFLYGQLGEISVEDTWRLLGVKHFFKPGVFLQVYLQNLLQKKLSTQSTQTKSTPKIPKQLLLNNILSLKKIVQKLKYPYGKASQVWANYALDNSYNNNEQKEKIDFVEQVLKKNIDNTQVVIDFGANTGVYSRLAANYASKVISVEYDPAALNFSYTNSRPNITYFLCDITKPTPALGFNLRERKSFSERVQGNFFLALALIHHLRISAGIPLEKVIDCLFQYASMGIIEWVDQEDPMVKQMLLNRENVFSDYTWENFLQLVSEKYKIIEVCSLSKTTRKLCLVGRK